MFTTDQHLQSVVEVVNRCPSTVLAPRAFFFSPDGVPLLVYRGFASGILQLQQQLSQLPGIIPVGKFAEFPKTTLGAVAADRTRLSRTDLGRLWEIAERYNREISAVDWQLPVNQLSVVIFETRSLERRIKTYQVSLDQRAVDLTIAEENRQYVEQQLAAFSGDRLDDFHAKMTACGYRRTHYRELYLESTLVFDLPLPHPPYVDAFIEAIDRELPGMFCWFGRHSRHATIRALYREQN